MQKEIFSIVCGVEHGLPTIPIKVASNDGLPLSNHDIFRLKKQNQTKCLLDTGANHGLISVEFAKKLGIDTGGKDELFSTPKGFVQTSIFPVDILFPNNTVVKGYNVGMQKGYFDILIGMDLTEYFDFTLKAQSGQFQLSFYHRDDSHLTHFSQKSY